MFRSFALAILTLAVLFGGSGCIGAVVGTIIDTAQNAVQYPVHEYVFRRAYKFDNRGDDAWRELEDDRGRDYGNELIGVAASGGGSRSAYFLTCVLDGMRRVESTDASGAPSVSLLDEIDYLSGVSGGSLAAAYYVLNRPPDADEAALDAFFARFREDMTRHFELRSLGRTAFLFRWAPLLFTYYHRGHVMASTWDANFFDGATFADLPEPRPPYPSLIVNATSYSSGHKFLFTRLASSNFNEGTLFGEMRDRRLITDGFDEAHRPLWNEGFDTIGSDIGSFKISQAVVASAGVPNLLGPVVLEDRSRDGALIALGDGGIYDNYGLETLVQLFTQILERRPELTARILVVDGSGYFPVESDVIDYSVASYSDRTATIAWLRAADYAEPLFGSLAAHGGRAAASTETDDGSSHRPLRLQVLSLYRRGRGRVEADRSGVQQAVGVVFDPAVGFFRNLNEAARAIGTRFKLGKQDADVIEQQANLVLSEVLER